MKNSCERILLTDLYEITMLQEYFMQQMNQRAVFEFYVRRLPAERNFLIAAGLAQVVDYLAALRFGEEDLTWLRQCGRFASDRPARRHGMAPRRCSVMSVRMD